MLICRVVGSLVSTVKHPSYEGRTLLVLRPTNPEGELQKGTLVAVDAVQSGVGDWVLVASGGGSSFDVLGLEDPVPLREVVVGVIDRIERHSKGKRQ